MARVTVNQVADYFINQAHEVGDPISHLKLQKLVYYAQAWYLALYGEALVDERFEAWVHGPVSPTLYQRFKGNSWSPIEADVGAPDLPPEVREHLAEIFEAYGGFSALDLERLTHAEEPWIAARGDLEPTAPSTNPISEDLMRRFYAARQV